MSSDFRYVNPYNYAENNPIVNIDLLGLQALNAFQAGLIGNDNQGYIRTATEGTRESSPFTAGIADATFFALEFLGLNAVDNAFFGSQESTARQKVAAVGTVLLNTRGSVDSGLRATTKLGTQVDDIAIKATVPYKRPNNATTKAQRESVQDKPCVDCGNKSKKMIADHKTPLVKEHYETGSANKTKMRELDAVQPQCPSCSAKQGAEMSKYSKKQKQKINNGN